MNMTEFWLSFLFGWLVGVALVLTLVDIYKPEIQVIVCQNPPEIQTPITDIQTKQRPEPPSMGCAI